MKEQCLEIGPHRGDERDQRVDEVRRFDDVDFVRVQRSGEKKEGDVEGRRHLARIPAPELKPDHVIQDLGFLKPERHSGNIKGASEQG